jgi:hypothetical protein
VCEHQVVLDQYATDVKSNEITAIPKLLDLLSLQGSTVTIDAMGRQRGIAKAIVDKVGGVAEAEFPHFGRGGAHAPRRDVVRASRVHLELRRACRRARGQSARASARASVNASPRLRRFPDLMPRPSSAALTR